MPSAETATPIVLSDAEPFAVGGRRLCFVHPLDPSLCVKVNRTDDARFGRMARKRIVPARLRSELDDNAHERRSLLALQRRLGNRFAHLPRYHADVRTDLGPGIAVDLIRDHDGRIARTVRALLCEGLPLDDLRPAFNEFGEFLVRNRVLTRALLDHNIAARRNADASWTLFFIDGYGDPAFLPVASIIPAVGRAKVRRRLASAWERFELLAQAAPEERVFDTSRWSQGFLNHRGVEPAREHR